MRECPTCSRRTDRAFCPADGAATVAAGPAITTGRQGTSTAPRQRRKRLFKRTGTTHRRLNLPAGGVTADHVSQDAARFAAPEHDEHASAPPIDLPRAWDAPAPPRTSRRGRETIFLTQNSDAQVGAAELLAATETAAENSAEIATDEGLAMTYAERDASNTVPRSTLVIDSPTSRHAPSEVPWSRSPTAEAAEAAEATTLEVAVPAKTGAAARTSGGWGDALFGGDGKTDATPADDGPVVVTSEARPHPIPVDRVAPLARQVDSDEPDDGDRRGLISTLLVVLLVGGALYFGGQFAWQKLQGPPHGQGEIAPEIDVPAPPLAKDLGESGGLDDDDDGEELPLLTYTTTLGEADHLGANGKRLTRPWQVIVNDRDRVHRGLMDPGDTKDPRFGSKSGRAMLGRLLRARRLPDDVRGAIRTGTPTVEIEIWPDQASVRVMTR